MTIAHAYGITFKQRNCKSVGADGISHKILREMAYYLAVSLAGIINSLLHQGIVPGKFQE